MNSGDFASPLNDSGGKTHRLPVVDTYRLRPAKATGSAGSRWVRRGRKLLLASTVLTGAAALSQMPSASAAECTDDDGDGYGWDGEKSCTPGDVQEPDEVEAPEGVLDAPAPDSDAIAVTQLLATSNGSYEFLRSLEADQPETATTTTQVERSPASPTGQPGAACADSDGDGFGWNGVATCIPRQGAESDFAIVDNDYLNPSGSLVSAVGSLRVSDGKQIVNVTWNAVSGATGYNVYRDAQYIGSANGGRLSLTDVIPLDSSGNYSIRAFDQFGTYGQIGSAVPSSFTSSSVVSESVVSEGVVSEGEIEPISPVVNEDPRDPMVEALPCVDDDGDGFGWDGTATCLPSDSAEDQTPVDDLPSGELPSSEGGPCSQHLLVVGDSWANYSFPALNETFTEQGWCVYRDSPDGSIDFAEIGSVSTQFQPGERLNDGVVQRLDQICKTACDDVSIVYSIGGNDHLTFPSDSDGQIEAATQLANRVATSIGSFAQVAPDTQFILPGYDILNVDNSALCRALPAFITGDVDAPLGVTAGVPRSIANINDILAAALPNTQHADLIGTLQGDPGNREITTLPARFLTADDCIHATAEGYQVFAEEIAMVVDPSLSLPGATAIDVNAPDPVAPDSVGPNARPGIGIQATTDIPENPATYDSLTIDYQVLNNIEMDDPNASILGVDVSDDEIELRIIEFGITPGQPDTAYARLLPRQGEISADEGDIKTIPDSTGLYGFSDLNPIGFEEFREEVKLPDLLGHVVIAYENDDGGLGNLLEDNVIQRAVDQLEIELAEIVGPIKEPLDIAVSPQLLIDQVFEGTDRVNAAKDPKTWLQKRLAEGFGQLVDTNVIFYFVTDPETSDVLNPAFDQFRDINTPAFGGAATNQSFVLDFSRGETDPDPHYEVTVDVRLGTGLATSVERTVPANFGISDSDGADDSFLQPLLSPAPVPIAAPTVTTQPVREHQSLVDERDSNGNGFNSLTSYEEPEDNTSSAPGEPGSYENVGNSGLSGAAG